MTIIELEQGTPEWLAWRARRRMASESPALCGVSPWAPKTPLQLWELKTGLTTIDQTPAMLHGIVHEGRARELYEWDHECRMDACLVEDEDQYGASLDGFSPGDRRIIEIKCPMKGAASDLWLGMLHAKPVIPEHYRVQVQHQLMVSGAEVCDFVVYDAELDSYRTAEIAPDPGRQLSIRFAWDAFWPFYESRMPPEAIEGDYVERFDGEWLELEAEYLLAKSRLRGAEAAEVEIRERLLALTGESSCRGEALRVTRYWARGNVDYAQIPILKGVDTEPYRKKGGYRFRIGKVEK